MFSIKKVYTPTIIEAIILAICIVGLISGGIIKFSAAPHIPILLTIFLLILYGLIRKVPFKKLEEGMTNGAKSGISAIFIFFLIGLLISAWMISGTIPTLVYLGFKIVSVHFFYAIAFITTAIVGMAIGSSLTTSATLGVAFIGVASAIDASLAITAGAIVSGAFFGDKMSPLSDTTSIASMMMKVDLFEHIRNMAWTTVPGFIISLIVYAIISPNASSANLHRLISYQESLMQTNLVHWYSLLPILVLVIFAIKKISAFITLAFNSIFAVILSYFHHFTSGKELFSILFNGYVSETGNTAIDSLLTRGGINSMMFTVSLIILALSMGGLTFALGIIPVLLQSLGKILNKVGSVIMAAALTAVGINIFIGEQYLSIILTGESFQQSFQKVGLANKNLSRVLEDAGTVVNPLVPWSVCGVFLTNVLGVSTLEYFPFAFFCLLSPLLTILFGFTGKTLTMIDKN
ncbi:Na+/H+ antiporter NhaC [Heyndrickxia oleronia]|uniref:Na+/H+ antiporter NhaC n=1 Tax=Heyndrickxia oleronia TaxID=38875 RepID=UPI0007170F51|nr:Na+/H+ antiporter NhaC [Heyndrickxia oleronia]NYV67306.1 Na+/H+ antiporter NhaC [Bacillus sp. Gen3]OJH17831.1 Na+/H+ antiporter NhaC [Bacillus obstructivus]MCI1589548.1 Na+/H+ antiporter NhaC [Heyndrickxia oleronia]MCI1611398.1 Na+/H+ antiporter NhaC [Heyndrickxia oleronia]MCI1742840.1 Na+/H+ antiporter NhaC [Heyndrickxia oleronia]